MALKSSLLSFTPSLKLSIMYILRDLNLLLLLATLDIYNPHNLISFQHPPPWLQRLGVTLIASHHLIHITVLPLQTHSARSITSGPPPLGTSECPQTKLKEKTSSRQLRLEERPPHDKVLITLPFFLIMHACMIFDKERIHHFFFRFFLN